jgi:hypothetical protein
MGRRGGEGVGPSTRAFVRPVTMLALGLAAGLAMWWVLMTDAVSDGSAGARPSPEQAQVWGAAGRAGGAER